MSGDYVERAVRRRVGLDALRRLRRLVDAQRQAEARDARWAVRLSRFFGAALLLGAALVCLQR